jgi:low affinity Fe/Cu permease
MGEDSDRSADREDGQRFDGAAEGRRSPESRLLHAVDRLASHSVVAVVVVTADAVWVAGSLVLHFPTRLENIFQTLVAALTLAMVFVIQHTQTREQIATQRKLDEILRALPHADNALIALEEASDAQLARAHTHHKGLRSKALDSDPG